MYHKFLLSLVELLGRLNKLLKVAFAYLHFL